MRFGFDADQYKSRDGSAREGGYQWTYLTSNGADGVANTGDEFDVARLQYTSQGANRRGQAARLYIEDSWNITDNFIAYLGGRWDTFENINGQGATYVKINNQFGPRLGFSWDVFGDSTFKVFGNAGRYALPLTPAWPSVARRLRCSPAKTSVRPMAPVTSSSIRRPVHR